jgi:hypothetical protein
MAISSYSTTPGSNTTISGINVAEGTAPANINDAIRQMMADIKVWYNAMDIGSDVQAYDTDLAALAANATNGLWARTGAGTGSARTITAGTNISVTNGNGVSGNPTIALTGIGTTIQAFGATLTSLEAISLVAGDVVYATAADTLARLALGASGTVLQSNGTAPTWATPILSKSYASAEQTITSAGALVLAHSMGIKPKILDLSLVCQTAEHGYSIGDEVTAGANNSTAGSSRHNAFYFDATNVNVRFSSDANCFIVANKTTGAFAAATNANWKLVVRAFA